MVDLKISQVNSNSVTNIIIKCSGVFGKDTPFTVKRGKQQLSFYDVVLYHTIEIIDKLFD